MTPETASNDFEMNRPTIVSLLYVASFLVGITSIIGVVLAYVWKAEASDQWEQDLYRYLIRTFWIGLVWGAVAWVGSLVTLFLLAWVLFPLVAVWFIVRSIMALMAAQKHQSVKNVETWLI